MAAVISTDIFCDGHLIGCECSNWVRGTTGEKVSLRAARNVARTKGWGRMRFKGKHIDICPDCCSAGESKGADD